MFALGLLGSLLVLGLPALVVVLVVRSSRRGEAAERAGPSLRRFLQYGFLLAAAFVAASGLALLVEQALPGGERLVGLAARDLALGLALSLVGMPVWLGLWRLMVRRLADDPDERGSLAWTLYLAAAATVALVVALVNLVQVGVWATGGDLDRGAVAAAVVWGAVWVLHAWLAGRRWLAPAGPLADAAVLAGAAVGLVALALGAAGILSFGLEQAYRVLVRDVVAEAVTTETLRRDVVLTLLAAGVWWWHWLRAGVRAPRSTLWHVHVVLLGVLGGLLTATVGTAIALHTALDWLFGVGDSASAAVHFERLPGALTAIAVGAWSWWYHRSVLAERERPSRTEPERTYSYLVAAVGLVAATAGAASGIVAAIQAVATPPLAAADPAGREAFVAALTLLAIGAPLWALYWRGLERRAGAGDVGERRSPSRRAYLFLVVGAGGLTAVGSAVGLLFVFFRDLLEGTLGTVTVYDLRVAVGVGLAAAAVTGYHWTVYREDRAARGQRAAAPRTVLLVTADGRDLGARLAARTGAHVRTLRRLDGRPAGGGDAPAVDVEAVAAAVLASPHERVLVLVDGGDQLRVIPFESA